MTRSRPVADRDEANRSSSAGPILTVDGLHKVYLSGRRDAREAVRDVSFEVARGEFLSIVGPSGAGKTTVLRCLSGLMPLTAGTVAFEGAELSGVPDQIGVVFQDYGRSLFPWLTIAGNVAVPLKVRGVPKAERRARVEEMLHAVGLGEVGKRYPWQLSGGMQQRVAIARALAFQPELLFMDEPFASVDAQTRFDLEDLILRLRSEFGVTVVLVTHDIDEAVYLADRVVVLSSSPSTVTEILPIPLEQPRDQGTTRSDERFAALRQRLFELVTGN